MMEGMGSDKWLKKEGREFEVDDTFMRAWRGRSSPCSITIPEREVLLKNSWSQSVGMGDLISVNEPRKVAESGIH